MAQPKIAVVFYSSTGTNHDMASAAAKAAEAAGAEVRLRRAAETAPQAAIDAKPEWKAEQARQIDIPVVRSEDLLWADGFVFSAPTRFGQVAAQMRAFIDTLGGLWSQGKLADKAVTAMTSAQHIHGGQEATILGLYTTFVHWGAVIVAPGYTDPAFDGAGGNPYGTSVVAGKFGETERRAVERQAARLVEFAVKLSV